MDAQPRNKWRRRIKGATGQPRFTGKKWPIKRPLLPWTDFTDSSLHNTLHRMAFLVALLIMHLHRECT